MRVVREAKRILSLVACTLLNAELSSGLHLGFCLLRRKAMLRTPRGRAAPMIHSRGIRQRGGAEYTLSYIKRIQTALMKPTTRTRVVPLRNGCRQTAGIPISRIAVAPYLACAQAVLDVSQACI